MRVKNPLLFLFISQARILSEAAKDRGLDGEEDDRLGRKKVLVAGWKDCGLVTSRVFRKGGSRPTVRERGKEIITSHYQEDLMLAS